MPILDLILIGLAVTLEPLPITAFILVLLTDRGPVKGAGYILGWLVSLVVVIAGVVLLTGGKPPAPHTSPTTAVLAIKAAAGALLIGIGLRQRRLAGRPRKPPTWMARLDRLSIGAAAAMGALLQPWVLVGAGAATVAQLHVSSAASFALLLLFCLLCTATLLTMELYTLGAPEAASARLDSVRSWIDAHRDQAITLLSLVLGLWLLGDSLYLIVS